MAEGDVYGNPVPWSTNPKKQSAAFKLFHYFFPALVSGLHLLTAEELATFGHVTTGDAETDRVLAGEERRVQLTPIQMIKIHEDGGGIRLTNPEDGAKIYEFIYQHMQDWRAEVEGNPTRRVAPIEDLRAMDEFARELYNHARWYMKFNPANAVLFARLDTLIHQRGGVGRGFIRGDVNLEPIKQPEHVSHIDPMTRTLRDRELYFRNR